MWDRFDQQQIVGKIERKTFKPSLVSPQIQQQLRTQMVVICHWLKQEKKEGEKK